MKEKLKVLITNSASLTTDIIVKLLENYKENSILIITILWI